MISYRDNANGGRDLEHNIGAESNLTVESCVNTCIAQNFTVAGMEFQ
jgi:hypothetical protein